MSRSPDTGASEQDAPFGARLRRAREVASLSQEELAGRAGLTPNAVGSLERGEHRHPYPATVRALADALGLTEDERAALAGSVPRRGRFASAAPASSPGLPTQFSPLIGREDEVAAIGAMLQHGRVRLVTLNGPGGVGKTRLALQIAAEHAVKFADGVTFVPLAGLRDPAFVADEIAQSLGVRDGGDRSTKDRLTDVLRARHQLLVLDNFEHLLASAPLVTHLLERCPRLTVIATSRAPLRLAGECEVPVLPLALPKTEPVLQVEDIALSAAIRLFVERARAVNPAFALTAENSMAVAAVCHRLDGLPLAIELAAARCRLIPPSLLLPRLARRLPLLTGGRRDAPDRHRTMRDAIAWSYDILSTPEQALFRRLGVFPGGFALDAAALVASDLGQDVLDGISALMENSLLRRAEQSPDEPRYAMLETVREYAHEQLIARNEAFAAHDLHMTWCLDLAERAAPYWFTSAQTAWGDSLDADHDNLRAALAWAAERGGTEEGLRLAGRLWPFWFVRGHRAEGRTWLERALSWGDGAPTVDRMRVLTGASCLARGQGMGQHGRSWGEEARKIVDTIGVGGGIDAAHVFIGLALDAEVAGDVEEVTSFCGVALAILRELKDIEPSAAPVESSILNILAEAALKQGNNARAANLAEEALAHQRRFGFVWATADALFLLAQVALREGRIGRAAALCAESLTLAREHQDPQQVPVVLDLLERLAASAGYAEDGVRLLGAADRLYEFHGLTPDAARVERVAACRARLGASRFDAAESAGRSLTTEHIFDEALALAAVISSVSH